MPAVRPRVALAFSLCLVASTTWADGETSWTAKTQRESIEALASAIEESYVDPDRAHQIAAKLTRRLEAGAYDTIGSPAELASRLTADLRPHDAHFTVLWQAPDEGPVLDHDSEEAAAAWREYARVRNSGFRRVEVLPGNVGYLDLRMFDGGDSARALASSAMHLLSNADALLIDLRDNGGGEPSMVQWLLSYFVGPEPVHYNSLVWRDGRVDRFETLAKIEGKRRPHVPLLVLMSARSASAAEGFAYAAQAMGRATVVGQPSSGGANPGQVVPLVHGFHAFISTGKAVNAITGKNWEGAGVIPDIEVPAARAYDAAYARALREILSGEASELVATGARWALEEIEARGEPRTLTSEERLAYPATYGDRQIRLRGDRLTYQRGRRDELAMTPLGDDRFFIESKDGFRLTFERDASGEIVRLVDQWVDGHVEANAREK